MDFRFFHFPGRALPVGAGLAALVAASCGPGGGNPAIVADTTPPGAVEDLAVSDRASDSVTLTWTAPGDNGSTGTASVYDIRYALFPIDEENWEAATGVDGEPAPQAPRRTESFTVTGLATGREYYFGLKTADEVPNWSVLSNVDSATTVLVDSSETVWIVPGEAPTIGAALDSAAVGDTVLVVCGTYREYDLDIKPGIFLRSVSGQSECVIIDAGWNGPVIGKIRAGSSVRIEGVTLTRGDAGGGDGGGIHAGDGADLELVNCVLRDNRARRGGGLLVDEGAVATVRSCTFLENNADEEGGGLLSVRSDPKISNCTFSENRAGVAGGGAAATGPSTPIVSECAFLDNSAGGGGGGFASLDGASPRVEGVLFSGNTAARGGGIRVTTGSAPRIEGCVFRENEATDPESGDGGGIDSRGAARIIDCVIEQNGAAREGGGIFASGGTRVDGTIFRDNRAGRGGGLSSEGIGGVGGSLFVGNEAVGAEGEGGAVAMNGDGGTIERCTFYENDGVRGGALHVCGGAHSIDRCLIARSLSGGALYRCDSQGGEISVRCTDLWGNEGGSGDALPDRFTDGGGNYSLDPLFCSAGDGDFTLSDDSPCLDRECGVAGAYGEGCP